MSLVDFYLYTVVSPLSLRDKQLQGKTKILEYGELGKRS